MARWSSWYQRWNGTLIEKMGPSQIGAGHPEAPDDRSVDHPCPLCGAPLSQHTVERPGGQIKSSTLHCPTR
ncbi:hypothetical protein [Curtobacterium ammoniigenes]|uniref:hypothetical protein n=1 Tax=Curtobacterium ammoniigenes TaxID=395387 RepID=UPI00082DD686|nr:hypothetical protein [Curtobacterium ammoniigenes]